jgi:8-amino-3,8-dideoxy-alpha-D-manno-octulosonate transaminase
MDRRQFLAVAAATTAAAQTAPQPVRTQPLANPNWGPLYYDDKELTQLTEVLESRRPFRFSPAPDKSKVMAFENEWAARMQTKWALAVTSGTAALHCALAALEIGPGDEVILPAWTWYSNYSTIIQSGALPVFAEIDDSFNLDPADIEHRITPATKLIMAVHLQGNPADLDPILAVARKHRIKVLEDCSQSVGASYKGKPLGSIGDIGTYSLQQTKTITAGEGGAVVTSDPTLYERAVRFHDVTVRRDFPSKLSYMPGLNYRMNEFSGGVLLAAVRRNASRVYDGVRDLPGIRLRRLPDPAGELGTGVFLGFTSKQQRDNFSAAMKSEGVPVNGPAGSIVLPIVPEIENKVTVTPRWPSFASERGQSIRYGKECCPRTIDILARYAGVMIGPKYTQRDTDDAIAAVRKVYPAIVKA